MRTPKQVVMEWATAGEVGWGVAMLGKKERYQPLAAHG